MMWISKEAERGWCSEVTATLCCLGVPMSLPENQ